MTLYHWLNQNSRTQNVVTYKYIFKALFTILSITFLKLNCIHQLNIFICTSYHYFLNSFKQRRSHIGQQILYMMHYYYCPQLSAKNYFYILNGNCATILFISHSTISTEDHIRIVYRNETNPKSIVYIPSRTSYDSNLLSDISTYLITH